MPVDTALKRYSAIHAGAPWRGVHGVPDGSITQRDRQVIAWLYSGILATSPPTTAAITGTATVSITEADIVAGGKTIIITLTNDTWVVAGATFNAQRQAIINGLDSAQAETNGWNIRVRDAEVVGAVVRTSDTLVTVTLSAALLYDITAIETITVTVPASALATSAIDVTGTPTFTVSVASSTAGGIKHGREVSHKGRQVIRTKPSRRYIPTDKSLELPTRDETPDELQKAPTRVRLKKPEQMSVSEINAEIGLLLRERLSNEDEERLLLLLMVSCS